MSDMDVHRIICPTVERERDQLLLRQGIAEEHVVFLRTALAELGRYLIRPRPDGRSLHPAAAAIVQAVHDDALPHEYDGNGWAKLQEKATP